jgi:hypothetical protein
VLKRVLFLSLITLLKITNEKNEHREKYHIIMLERNVIVSLLIE